MEEGIPVSEIMTQMFAARGFLFVLLGRGPVYTIVSQNFSPASLKRVVSAFDGILNGEAERLYRERPSSKWTVQTLAAYTELDRPLLITTRAQLQHLIDQEVYYCRIQGIEEVDYARCVYDFEVENHHNFVANNILCHNTIQFITLLLHDRTVQQDTVERVPTLLICPMSIVGNWHKELTRFAPSLIVMIHHGH